MPSLDADGLQRALGEAGYRLRGVPRADDVQVRLQPQALAEMQASVAAAAPLVQAGVLLGEVQQSESSFLVTVARAIEFPETRPEATHVRVPRRAWQQILRRRQVEFRSLRIVGWYHSHPGLGASFSEGDRFIQRYFFPAEWQVACVVDPQRDDVQFFQRRGRQVVPTGGFYTAAEAPARPHLTALPQRPAAPAGDGRGGVRKEGERAVLEREGEGAVRPQSDNFLRERFVERSLEKIQRLLKEPPMHPRDYVMLAMLALLALLVVFYRPPARDSAQLAAISQKLDVISQRMDALQRVGADVPAFRATSEIAAPDASQPDVVHPLSEGETLWSVCNAYYHDGGLMKALMLYNHIPDAQSLQSGYMLHIPSRARLERLMKAQKKAAPKGG